MMLDGGSDSHNMLVPHSGCSGGKSEFILKSFLIFFQFATHLMSLTYQSSFL